MTNSKTNLHAGHRQRLREKFKANGLQGFEEHQLLELLLTFGIPRKDTNELAHTLIKTFGSFKGVLDTHPDFLMQVDGVGENLAVFLSLVGKICEKYFYFSSAPIHVNTYKEIEDLAAKYLKGLFYEEIVMICLDANNNFINAVKVGKGDANSASASKREMISVAIRNKANKVIFAHNHPHELATPSFMDDDFTERVVMQFESCGIEVIDHIIVGKGNHYSYRNSGLLAEYQRKVKK